MSIIKGNGGPGRKTKASAGDTYIDLKSGNQYKCLSAYSDSAGNFDCVWKLTDTGVGILEEEDKKEEVTESDIPKEEETPVEEPKQETDAAPVRKNYTQYNKFNKK